MSLDSSGPVGAASEAPDLTAAPADPPGPDRYERLGLIGVGGMGRVWLARDRRLGRDVALKEARDERLAARLAREVRVTAGLEHPGIVTVYDEGRGADGRAFYTMRLMRGRPLAQVLAGGPAAAARLAVLRHYLDACQALAYAHARGVVHRDLKPANIMLGAFGETQVVDWGLARRLADDPDDPPGVAVGTPAYMSPEQARGAPADRRADVWGLGVVLRELLAGSPRADLPPDTPPELAAIVTRATADEQDARYPDAGALAADVAAFLDGRRVEAHRYTALEIGLRFVRAWRVPLAVAAAALVAITALVAIGTLRLRAQRDRAVAAEEHVRAALAVSDRNLAAALVAEARAAGDRGARAAGEVLAAHALHLVDSPEARGLLAGAWAAARPTRLASAPAPACHPLAALAPDDFVCADGPDVWRTTAGAVRWRTTTPRPVRHLRVDAGRVWPVAAAIDLSPLDLATGAPAPALWHVHAGNVGDPVPYRDIDSLQMQQRLFTACAASEVVGVAGAAVGPRAVLCADGRLGRLADEPTALAPALDPAAFVTFTHLALTPDGRRAVVAGTHGHLAVHDFTTGETRVRAPWGRDPVRRLAIGPDGARAAIARERGGVELIAVADLRPIGTIPATAVVDLRLFADGTALIATAADITRWAVPAQPWPAVFADPHGVAGLALAPDGRTLLTAHGEGRAILWDLATGEPRHTIAIGRGTMKAGAFFPAGDRFVVVQSDRGPSGPHVFATATGAPLWDASPARLDRWRRARGADASTNPIMSRRVAVLEPDILVTALYGPGLLTTSVDRDQDIPLVDCPYVEWKDLAAAPDGARGVLVSIDGAVHLLDPGPALRCRPVPAPPGAVAADVSADGRIVVLGAARSLARSGPDGLAWTVAHPGPFANDVALSPDARWVASAGPDDAARLWDAATGELRAVLTGHHARVAAVDFSHDGELLATGSWDGTARLWRLAALDAPVDVLARDAEATWGLSLADALAR